MPSHVRLDLEAALGQVNGALSAVERDVCVVWTERLNRRTSSLTELMIRCVCVCVCVNIEVSECVTTPTMTQLHLHTHTLHYTTYSHTLYNASAAMEQQACKQRVSEKFKIKETLKKGSTFLKTLTLRFGYV
jgi:hypothetical protein